MASTAAASSCVSSRWLPSRTTLPCTTFSCSAGECDGEACQEAAPGSLGVGDAHQAGSSGQGVLLKSSLGGRFWYVQSNNVDGNLSLGNQRGNFPEVHRGAALALTVKLLPTML